MKISSFNIDMESKREYENYKKQQIQIGIISKKGTTTNNNILKPSPDKINDNIESVVLDLSEEAKNIINELSQNASITKKEKINQKEQEEIEISISEQDKRKIELLEKLLERLTGKKVVFYMPSKIKIKNNELDEKIYKLSDRNNKIDFINGTESFNLNINDVEYESELVSFIAEGGVATEDGRIINFSVDFNLKREYYNENSIRIVNGKQVKDPLVINYKNITPVLTDRKYKFDIDFDGKIDEISFVGSGSGFLAFDINKNGIIDDGSELFGTRTGNGFEELKKHDNDMNGWIDENDEIFQKLVVWIKEEGNDKLLKLSDLGIGAININNISTEFSLKDAANNLKGQIKNTGIFISEDGKVGTINQIDIAL